MKVISLALSMVLLLPATVMGASLTAEMHDEDHACCCGVDTAVHIEAPLECPCCAPGVPAPDVTPGVMVHAPVASQAAHDVTPVQIKWPTPQKNALEGDLARGPPPNTPIRLRTCRINR